MTGDDLYRSLGGEQLKRHRAVTGHGAVTGHAPVAFMRASTFGGVVLALLMAGAGVLMLYGDPMGGRPHVIALVERQVLIEPQKPLQKQSEEQLSSLPQTIIPSQTPPIDPNSAAGIEAQSGVRVSRPEGMQTPNSVILKVQNPLNVSLPAAPIAALVERTKLGALPKISNDGLKPLEAYARPVLTSSKLSSSAPKIALLVGGMGLNTTASQMALEQLPGEITFGFAPYSATIAAQVADAREKGHEVILQIPMEPFDYPRNDPGPHTLLTSLAPAQNMDNLHWFMTRFSGYIGVSNFLGANFLAEEENLTPILREIAGRGVAFIEDGTVTQSVASALAQNLGLSYIKVNVVLDINARPGAMEAAFTRLEAQARDKGFALGMANAHPANLERLVRFAKSLESRGIALVPVSALANELTKRNNAIKIEINSHEKLPMVRTP